MEHRLTFLKINLDIAYAYSVNMAPFIDVKLVYSGFPAPMANYGHHVFSKVMTFIGSPEASEVEKNTVKYKSPPAVLSIGFVAMEFEIADSNSCQRVYNVYICVPTLV